MYTSKQISEIRQNVINQAKELAEYFEGHTYLYELTPAELDIYDKYCTNLQRQAAQLQTLYSLARRRENRNVTKTKTDC